MANKKPQLHPENLKPCKPGETHNPNGRPKKLVTAIKSLPKDMQEQVYGVLAFALTLPDETTAKQYLMAQKGSLGKYGFVLQIAIRQLCKDGWGFNAMMDIMDRLQGYAFSSTAENVVVECHNPSSHSVEVVPGRVVMRVPQKG